MKRFALLPALVLAMTTLSASAQTSPVQPVNNNSNMPYKTVYNNISIGNMAYTMKVLQLWKDYDNNNFDNMADLFAEDLIATFPDGTVIKGRDNFIKMGKEYRNSLQNVSSVVDACTTLKTPDRPDQEVVTIWGMETDTHKDGTVTKTHLNEVWFFNKNGKVTEFHQMAAKDSPDQK